MIYVAIGQLAGAALEKALSPIVVVDDNLLVGPSRIDIKRHRAVRARYWGNAPSRAVDQLLARGDGEAICVVIPPTANGLLSLCRVCSKAIETGRDVHVIDLTAGTSVGAPNGIDPVREAGLDVRRIARRLPAAARWSDLQVAMAAALWRLWCRRSPVALSRFCATASAVHTPFANLGCYHAGFFPRVTDRGLSVSRIDELILRQLSREWLTPAKMYASAVASSSPLAPWLSYTGDLYLVARLLQWSEHRQGTIVERRKESPPGNSEMLAWSFRWREGAEAMVDGLQELGAAPPVTVGGAVAYDAKHPSVCSIDKTGRPYLTRANAFRSSGDTLARCQVDGRKA
ncbi:MAG: hypothetical protein IPK82_43935 [Polyangiaceae bacterium]|nr:hypothetical protein [Polyangiaceae bacterium]